MQRDELTTALRGFADAFRLSAAEHKNLGSVEAMRMCQSHAREVEELIRVVILTGVDSPAPRTRATTSQKSEKIPETA